MLSGRVGGFKTAGAVLVLRFLNFLVDLRLYFLVPLLKRTRTLIGLRIAGLGSCLFLLFLAIAISRMPYLSVYLSYPLFLQGVRA